MSGMTAIPLCRFRDMAVKLESSDQPKEDLECYDLPISQISRKNQCRNALRFSCMKRVTSLHGIGEFK